MKKEIKVIIVSILVIIGCAFALFTKNNKKEEASTTNAHQSLVRDFNHKTGPDDAKVKIVEFLDPECEACAAFYPHMKDVLERYNGKVQLTVRYALYHGSSTEAAKATEAAGKQGKYWEYQGLLFTRQGEWSHRSVAPIDLFESYAANLGLNVEQFKKDMQDPAIGSILSIDVADGKTIGIQGTPTIFINGVMLEKLHPSALIEKIDEELKQ